MGPQCERLLGDGARDVRRKIQMTGSARRKAPPISNHENAKDAQGIKPLNRVAIRHCDFNFIPPFGINLVPSQTMKEETCPRLLSFVSMTINARHFTAKIFRCFEVVNVLSCSVFYRKM